MILTTALCVGFLYAVGTYLLLQRTLTRIVIGLALMSHGANLLLLLAGGPPGAAPLAGAEGDVADPLPQALALTAIVITFGVTAFLLSMAYRSWQLTGHDEAEDDLEDRRISRLVAEHQRRQDDEELADLADLEASMVTEPADEPGDEPHDESAEGPDGRTDPGGEGAGS